MVSVRWLVEQTFRTAKAILRTRPIYHQSDVAIRVHIFCPFLTLPPVSFSCVREQNVILSVLAFHSGGCDERVGDGSGGD